MSPEDPEDLCEEADAPVHSRFNQLKNAEFQSSNDDSIQSHSGSFNQSYDEDSNIHSSENFKLSPNEMMALLNSPCPKAMGENELSIQMPEWNPQTNYYDLYWDLYLKNENLMNEIAIESCERDNFLRKKMSI